MKRDWTEYLYLGNRIVEAPLEALFPLLIFILNKEFGASPLILIFLACAKPIVSLVSFHISSWISDRTDRIRSYLFGMTCLAALPTLLFSLIESLWFCALSYILFMIAQRAAFPGWNQLLKEKLGTDRITSWISGGIFLQYLLIMAISLGFSSWVDQTHEIWRLLFSFAAFLKTLNLLFVYFLQKKEPQSNLNKPDRRLLLPWKLGINLLKQRSDFRDYLALYFLGGVGIIAIQPILPFFLSETLSLSYTELAMAISVCKGVAFLFTLGIWAKLGTRISLYKLNGYINLFSILFFSFLVFSSKNTAWVYLAFLMYGTMQGGSELSWNLSGPFFSREKESSIYSSLNLALVGIRGCICPILAQLLFYYTNIQMVLLCSGAICVISLLYSLWLDQKYLQKESYVI